MNALKLLLCLVLVTFQALAEPPDDVQVRIQEAQKKIAEASAELARLMTSEESFIRAFDSTTGPRLGVILSDREEAVTITGVTPRSPAAEAGLQRGDRIVSVAGTAVDEADDPATAIRDIVTVHGTDTPLPMVIERDGAIMELEVTPETRSFNVFSSGSAGLPDIDALLEGMEIDLERILGDVEQVRVFRPEQFATAFRMPAAVFSPIRLQLAENSPQLGAYFGTSDGVLVLKPDSRHDLGLRAGDVILRLNGAELRRPGDFYHQLGDLEAGSTLHLEIMRHGNLESLEAEVPEGEQLGMRQPGVKVLWDEGL